MQGTVLIVDGVSTNRIMLKVLLSSAWYHVVQADRIGGITATARRVRPDAVVTAMTLPDGDAPALRAALAACPDLAALPVIAIAPQNDRAARLRALEAGLDDVLNQPVDDTILQARLRRLIRARSAEQEFLPRLTVGDGLAEAPARFAGPDRPASAPARIALVSREQGGGALWRVRLREALGPRAGEIRLMSVPEVAAARDAPDLFVLHLDATEGGAGLALLSELRAWPGSRHAAIVALTDPGDARLAAEALDRGADDVMETGFCAEELALRIRAQLARKARLDLARARLRDGLAAARTDPLTGLSNRRHADGRLEFLLGQARHCGSRLAVMMLDLDHFKAVNDRHGHATGDAVLIEAGRRLRVASGPAGMAARYGGEEFLVACPVSSPGEAEEVAERLRRAIAERPFPARRPGAGLAVTASIGVAVTPPPGRAGEAPSPTALIRQADRALYRAKAGGRNRVVRFRGTAIAEGTETMPDRIASGPLSR